MLMNRLLEQALTRPHQIAARQQERALDYAQLVGRARAFARMLAARGVLPGDRIAVVAPKSLETLVALIGTSLNGSVFVPCESRMPPERLARVLHDCDPKGLVSTGPIVDQLHQVDRGLLTSLATLVSVDRCSLDNAIQYDFELSYSDGELPRIAGADSAYVLYTSGTTGEPKGVVHSHDSATSFVNWAAKTLQLSQHSVVANHAQWSFDLSVFDLWTALSCGARVELVPFELSLRPREFVRELAKWRTTHFYSVPSLISLLESDGGLAVHGLPELSHLLYAGEPFAVPRLRDVLQALPNSAVYNLFGPTETNVCLYHRLPGTPDASMHQVPIGRACEHLTVELLDEYARPTAPSTEGEICVAGPSVLSEYFRRPAETECAFFAADRFADGRRRYRTGDRAQLDEDGLYWFHGRRDRLIKRRGFRVELGEVEAVVSHNPNVKEAAAYVVQSEAELRIHVAVVLRDGGAATPLALRAHCGRFLPAYMVPDTIELLGALPRTANGKVDLKRLSETSAV